MVRFGLPVGALPHDGDGAGVRSGPAAGLGQEHHHHHPAADGGQGTGAVRHGGPHQTLFPQPPSGPGRPGGDPFLPGQGLPGERGADGVRPGPGQGAVQTGN